MQTLTRDELIAENGRLQSIIEQPQAKVSWFEEQFKLSRARQYGSSSESTAEVSQGALLFNEAEATLDSTPVECESETITCARKRKQPGHRQEMLADLPVETIEYRLSEDEQVCKSCGGPMHEII